MNKTKWGILSFLLALISIFSMQQTVNASKNYQITDYNEIINIQKDGTADVTQRITYDFKGKFQDVYYNMDLKGTKGASIPKVSIEEYGYPISVHRETDHGDYFYDDTFVYSGSKYQKKLKVYHVIEDNSAVYIYKYKIYGAITNYNDVAEMNWKVIGSKWERQIQNAKVVVNLPGKNITGLRAWTHGPLNGYTKVNKDIGRVTLTVSDLPVNTFVESRLIFPTSVTAANTNKKNKSVEESILKEEKQVVIEANRKRQKDRILFGSTIVVFLIAQISLYVLLYKKWIKAIPKKKVTPIHHYLDIPKMKPSIARMIVKDSHDADQHGLTGDLLMEVTKKNLKLNRLPDGGYEIERLNKDCDQFFIDIIDDFGDVGYKVTFKDLKKYGKVKLNDDFNSWVKRTENEAKPYFSARNEGLTRLLKSGFVGIAILDAALMFLASMFNSNSLPITIPMAIIFLLIWGILYLVASHKFDNLKNDAEQTAAELKGLRQLLKDVDDINVAEVGDLVLWEQLLPYAAAFGVSKKIIKALKLEFGEDIVNIPVIGYYSYGYNSFSSSSNFTMTASSGTSDSSSGGFSGGFSGGDSGGFGGGSGGGAD